MTIQVAKAKQSDKSYKNGGSCHTIRTTCVLTIELVSIN